jgi:hypothetical protein
MQTKLSTAIDQKTMTVLFDVLTMQALDLQLLILLTFSIFLLNKLSESNLKATNHVEASFDIFQ